MGKLSALEIGHHAPDLDAALIWHLRSNHLPPIPFDNLEPAKQAIKLGNRAIAEEDPAGQPSELWDQGIYLPTAGRELPVWRIIEGMHLDSFLDAVQLDVYGEPGGQDYVTN